MRGLLWIRYSSGVKPEDVDQVLMRVAPFFKDQGIELVVIPEGFDIVDRAEAIKFLKELKDLITDDAELNVEEEIEERE